MKMKIDKLENIKNNLQDKDEINRHFINNA